MAHLLCRTFSPSGKSAISGVVALIAKGGGHRCVKRPDLCVPVATLIATHGEKFPYQEPWDYENKKFQPRHYYVYGERTMDRLNENSKVIIVEGAPGVGKNDLAKKLASSFDLKYFPSITEAKCFEIPSRGIDERELAFRLPDHLKPYDLEKFYSDSNPQCGRIGRLQWAWYRARFYNYCEALLHVLSTGQGVVISQSVFGDIAYATALKEMGYITRKFARWYEKLNASTIVELLMPHITIYLNAPVSVLRQRIKERNNPIEQNSAVFSDKYLEAIDRAYHNRVLPHLRQYGEFIEIDWAEKADPIEMDVIVEELASLPLERESEDDPRFETWKNHNECYASYRTRFGKKKEEPHPVFVEMLLNSVDPPLECTEVVHTGESGLQYQKAIESLPFVNRPVGWMAEYKENVLAKFR